MTSGGHWVVVAIPNASGRHDWVPEAQPPSPDGRPGTWHVVPDPGGGESRWEWFGTPAPAVPRRRAAVGVASACFVVALIVGFVLARSGGTNASAANKPATGARLDDTVAAAAKSESGCEEPREKPTEGVATAFYRCRYFDLYVYNATHDRDVWVAGFQRRGRVVRSAGTNWIALTRAP